MNNFEVGRLIGRLEVVFRGYDIEKEIEMLEDAFKYEDDIRNIARIYGRLEQKMIIANKSKKDILELRKLFEEVENKCIELYLDKDIKDLNLIGLPVKKLNEAGIYTIRDLSNKTYNKLLEINGISEITLKRILDKLRFNCVVLKKN